MHEVVGRGIKIKKPVQVILIVSLKEMLQDTLREDELAQLRRSFEIIGDIVIVDIPDELMHVKDEIVDAILKKHKHVKTILRKVGEVEGEYRVAAYDIIYGHQTETIVKEHGCRFLVDPTKVYYSVKLSGERERVTSLVEKDEIVLVMFAGVGPYAIIAARNHDPYQVIGVEANPKAVEYFKRNIELNKVEDKVEAYEGDVRDIVPLLEDKFDRILMPSPNTAEMFVDVVGEKIKEGGSIHYYTFGGEEEEEQGTLNQRVKDLFEENGMLVEIEKVRRCGHFAPYVHRYVLDLKVIAFQ
ncbi:MAG: class I SAM-dependent methyltransferase family protein [Archaeoglobaceae archaeon]